MRENPKTSLKLRYKKVLELGLIISLVLHIFLMQGFKKLERRSVQRTVSLEALQVEEIPQTEQDKSAPAPARPSVPIASEDEDLPEDETIEETFFDEFAEATPPPEPPVDDSAPVFVPHDESPTPVGGMAAIQSILEYPEIALRAGVEGTVLIYAQVDVDGIVKATRVVKSLGNNGTSEAAVKAIRSVKWIPAKQRDKPVRVWVVVPVIFKLK
ncbi:MAG TPA: energy transducer TonB [bacterium]|nr:energy transducer TonB [bacterium]